MLFVCQSLAKENFRNAKYTDFISTLTEACLAAVNIPITRRVVSLNDSSKSSLTVPLAMPRYCCTVELPVSDHPKYQDLVVAYGRWSLTRVEPEGDSTGNGSVISISKRIYCIHFPNSSTSSARLSLKVPRKLRGVAS